MSLEVPILLQPIPSLILQLQRSMGNHVVAQLISEAKRQESTVAQLASLNAASATGRGAVLGAPPARAPLSLQRAPCPVTGEFLNPTPSGRLPVEIGALGRNRMLHFGFQVRARFRPVEQEVGGEPCDCRRGEYRQLVKGKYEIGGKRIDHRLFDGERLSADVFKEDGKHLMRYGHRDFRSQASNFYRDEGMETVDENGAYFRCSDSPWLKLPQEREAKTSRVELEFVGRLVDAGDSDKVLEERAWSANYVHVPMAPLRGRAAAADEVGEIVRH